MKSGIVIVRQGEHYRLLFGHLRLAGALGNAHAICIDVKGEGTVRILKTSAGLYVKKKNCKLPLLMH